MGYQLDALLGYYAAHNRTYRYDLGALHSGHFSHHVVLNVQHIRVVLLLDLPDALFQLGKLFAAGEPVVLGTE